MSAINLRIPIARGEEDIFENTFQMVSYIFEYPALSKAH